jgi:hypothetical protein
MHQTSRRPYEALLWLLGYVYFAEMRRGGSYTVQQMSVLQDAPVLATPIEQHRVEGHRWDVIRQKKAKLPVVSQGHKAALTFGVGIDMQ